MNKCYGKQIEIGPKMLVTEINIPILCMCRDALFFFNGVALEDADFGVNFAYLFASQQVQELNEQFNNREESNVIRSNILNMLQENYKGMLELWLSYILSKNRIMTADIACLCLFVSLCL